MENLDINTMFENAMNDPTLLSTIDINKLLDTLENDKNDYLENKTIENAFVKFNNRIPFESVKEPKFKSHK